ncbi:AAA family ATPase [Roseibacterium sp. SDUM158016]|uniref:AAA family ATPase n=1 Tax=Roseicyclus sediminis TaxID=2980997 RepID=UPI0021D3D79A|nr:MoxR family ATPase [Roseibacterium sp. SDUM158016]MCU4653296.1 AAA family ATPase [Roseibacterium sp. SDUM158016]
MNVQTSHQTSSISKAPELVGRLREHLSARVVGQSAFIDKLLIALLADGHVLVEGAPGLAKTRAIVALSRAIDCDEKRVQFTPDLLPGDLTGTEVWRPEEGAFKFQKGPLFHNLILADEINRAPAKVQSALLEAMAERQITVGGQTYPLPRLFMVMATQNPIEQEGTYPLPEAQLDRFLMHVRIGYPDAASERDILRIARGEAMGEMDDTDGRIPQEAVFAARRAALEVHVSPALESYILALIQATRSPGDWDTALAGAVAWGASPRGTIALDRCARVHAMMRGSDYATPSDVQAVAHDVLRHRVIPTFEAEADGMTPDRLIDRLLDLVPVT